jgi:hypothetical protein
MLSISDIAFVSTPLNHFRDHLNNVRSRVSTQECSSEVQSVQSLIIRRYGLPQRLRENRNDLSKYVNTWIGSRRKPPHNKVPPKELLPLLLRLGRLHPKALQVGVRMLCWEQMADLARRAGLLESARRVRNVLGKHIY